MDRKGVTIILCIFLGTFGAHRFYNRKYLSGILYLLTCGLFFIGWIYDIYAIATNRFNYPTDTVNNLGGYPDDCSDDSNDKFNDYVEFETGKPNAFSEIDALFPKAINGYHLCNVYEIDVVGTKYNDVDAAWRLHWGDEIVLMPFSSEHDPKGVKVLTANNKHIGWIAKDSTYKNTIFNGINNGVPFPAKVFDVREYEELPYIKISAGWYR